MNDLRAQLREADPVRAEPALPADEALRMRRRVLAAAGPRARSLGWRRALAAAALVAMMIGAGSFAGRRMTAGLSDASRAATPPAVAEATDRLQVQFATPGGTRIIWTIDPQFHLNEVLK